MTTTVSQTHNNQKEKKWSNSKQYTHTKILQQGKIIKIAFTIYKDKGSKTMRHSQDTFKTILVSPIINYLLAGSCGGLMMPSCPPSFVARVAALISLQWLMNLLTSWFHKILTQFSKKKTTIFQDKHSQMNLFVHEIISGNTIESPSIKKGPKAQPRSLCRLGCYEISK